MEYSKTFKNIVVPRVVNVKIPRLVPAKRKLLLFVGHIPKLYLSPLRFHIWYNLQMMQDSNITVHSHTIKEHLQYENMRSKKFKRYRNVNFTSVKHFLRGEECTYLNTSSYSTLLFHHKFVIVSRGDFKSTSKISESILSFAQGAAVPIFIVPDFYENMFPYVDQVNYSRVGFVVHETTVYTSVTRLVSSLYDISDNVIEKKRQYAKRVQNMFSFQNSTGKQLFAADYILLELCRRNRMDPQPIPLTYLI